MARIKNQSDGPIAKPGKRKKCDWLARADRAWSKLVRAKLSGLCAVCGEPVSVAHHIIPRSHAATRHDLDNGMPLCALHHSDNPNATSPHGDRPAFRQWFIQSYPQWFARIEAKRYLLTRRQDYKAVALLLEAKWEARHGF